MARLSHLIAGLAGLALSASAWSQPVTIAPLAAPDLFSTGGRDTGLNGDIWRETSGPILRAVLPLLAARPLPPAAAALARRVLATGASAPPGGGKDAGLAGVRIAALTTQGDLAAAARILSRTSGLDRNPELATAAAEAALLSRDDERACVVERGLGAGRDGVYWLRLRAYCQARAGQTEAARLTLDLAQTKVRDPVYGRLMGAKLDGLAAGPPTLRNGLDYALARDLGLDLSVAKPAPAVAAALAQAGDPGQATWVVEPGPGEAHAAWIALAAGDLARAQQIRGRAQRDAALGAGPLDLAILDAAIAAASGKLDEPVLDRLAERGSAGDPKAWPRAQTATLYLAALGAPLSEAARGEMATFTVAAGRTPAARAAVLEAAAQAGRLGETALVALWIAADAGPQGLAPADRARVIRALDQAGLKADARAFAVEGLVALR